MTDAATEFFRELGRRGHEPSLAKATGTIRFDLVEGTRTDRWLLTFDRGDVSVSRKNVAADCIVRMSRSLFAGIASGEVNGMAAFLRGELTLEGSPEFIPELIVLMRRLRPVSAARDQR